MGGEVQYLQGTALSVMVQERWGQGLQSLAGGGKLL